MNVTHCDQIVLELQAEYLVCNLSPPIFHENHINSTLDLSNFVL